MANEIIWCDGFDKYGPLDGITGNLFNLNKYQGTLSLTVRSGRNMGYSVEIPTGGTTRHRFRNNDGTAKIFSADEKVSAGFAFFYTGTASGLLEWNSITQAQFHTRLSISSAGNGQFIRRTSASTSQILANSTFTLTSNNWYYLEMAVQISPDDSTARPFSAYINNSLWLSGTSITKGTGLDPTYEFISWSGNFLNSTLSITSTTPFKFDDLYIRSGTLLLGDSKVETRMPQSCFSAGTFSEWTPVPDTSFNSDAVNSVPTDDDTKYVKTNTIGTIDTYFFEPLEVITGTIDAVQISYRAKKQYGSGDHNLAPIIYKTTTFQGTTISNATQFNYIDRTYIKETDVDNNPWTVTIVNSTEFGIKLVD